MSKTNNIVLIESTFHCPDCMLIYNEGDTITIREFNSKIVHDCDNCLGYIELDIKDGKATIK